MVDGGGPDDRRVSGTLRTRRIARNRQRLVEVALPAFAELGYDGVTVDRLCDEAEVSKRAFFRYFAGKEDLALTPLNDVWRTLIADLDGVLDRRGLLLDVVGEALGDVVERMPDGWERLAVLSTRLSATTPAIDAAAYLTCERFTRQVLDAVTGRLAGRPDADLVARVVCAAAIAVHRAALDTWASRPGAERTATRAELRALLRAGFADARTALAVRLD
ncbi:TetR/AcrR family transcriptional regulator [Promicromonospora sp. NPDC052451]|uniref:TetR/AcrR family transcriptional regulator n=1 Tax=Promicromonospora sp. NPDC052451 TaxID=3364407 RepID=UPI0037C5A52D